MADVSIRKLDDLVVEALKARAKLHECSLEEEIRRTLADSLLPAQQDFIQDLARARERLRVKYGTFPDSTPDIRKERDEM